MQALKQRQTIREISEKKLPLQMLSNLLWAAAGINRPKGKGPFGTHGITAASASNSQEIQVYAVMKEGTYLFDPQKHALVPIAGGDLRSLAIGRGQQTWGSHGAVRLIYVVDMDRYNYSGFDEPKLHDLEGQKSYFYTDTGLIAGNVYLFCASVGLASWFHNCNQEELREKLHLREEQKPLFGHTVGYPKK